MRNLPEALYENALCVELRLRDVPFVCQMIVQVEYKGEKIGERKIDLLRSGPRPYLTTVAL